jgi:RNA polymerase sigma-70 factor, ECF subfamily
VSVLALPSDCLQAQLEHHRPELTGYCRRMLDSPFEAEDAVQETLLRAWRNLDRLQGRGALRAWLYRIATNVSFDMLKARTRRGRPTDLGPWGSPAGERLSMLGGDPEAASTTSLVSGERDPAELIIARETLRLALIAALDRLTGRQRAVLILRDVLRCSAGEVAELLETSVPAVNSALQRARGRLESCAGSGAGRTAVHNPSQRAQLARYVQAFEAHDIDALTSLLRNEAMGVA